MDPQGIKNYTIKAEVKYPADILEVKSFTFGSKWMPLSQSGYDLIDNNNGILIKTAGYPGGVSSQVILGTISFLAKKTGNGSISVGDNSLALDLNNADILSLSPASYSAVTVSPPAPTIPVVNEAVEELEAEAPAVDEEKTEQEVVTEEDVAQKIDTFGARLIGLVTASPMALALGVLVGFGVALILRRKKLI